MIVNTVSKRCCFTCYIVRNYDSFSNFPKWIRWTVTSGIKALDVRKLFLTMATKMHKIPQNVFSQWWVFNTLNAIVEINGKYKACYVLSVTQFTISEENEVVIYHKSQTLYVGFNKKSRTHSSSIVQEKFLQFKSCGCFTFFFRNDWTSPLSIRTSKAKKFKFMFIHNFDKHLIFDLILLVIERGDAMKI